MRIIGGKDYYDGGLAYGQDETLVFVRKKKSTTEPTPAKTIPLKVPGKMSLRQANTRFSWMRSVEIKHKNSTYIFSPIYVWFAGKRHSGIFVEDIHDHPKGNRTFWNVDSFKAFLAQIGAAMCTSYGARNDIIDDATIDAHFTSDGSNEEKEWLAANGIAIAILDRSPYRDDGWFFNTDGLKAVDFARHITPYEAFQELSMYVGGVIKRPEKPTVTITDSKVLAGKHGFNEWSFRKPPGMK